MVSDKFRPDDLKHPEPKHIEAPKGQDVLKAEKKEVKFSSHTIKSGETLSEICQQYGIPLKALYAVNQHELDPKIMLKDGKIAYGAPTYHVGDKLNIPSQADIPNAVKFFDQWAKAVIAKQRMDKPESAFPGKPAGAVEEKPYSRTQMMDDEHLAAKNAALMAKMTIETKYNQFRTQHEGQGSVDDAWDWMKKTAGLGDSSADIERDFKNQRALVDLMTKAAKNEDLRQFKNLYQQCTGKNYNQNDFLQPTKKPVALAFEDLADKYRKSQEAGNRGIQLGAAGLVAATAFIPGAAPVSLSLASRLAIGAGLGAVASGAADYANLGKTDNLGHSMTDGAIVGVSVAASIPIAGAAETGILAAGANAATKYAPTVRVMAGLGGGVAGGGAAGGMVGFGETIHQDARKGTFDPGHLAQKTGEGIVTGAVIGGPIGATGPLLKNVINIAKPATTEATAAAGTEVVATESASTAASPRTSEAFNKTSQLPKETTAPPTDSTKVIPPPKDVPKTAPPTDATKTTPTTDTGKSTPQQTDVTKGAPQSQQDLSKATPQGDAPKGSAQTSTTPDATGSDKWNQGSTHDLPPSQKPDVSKYVQRVPQPTPEEAWQMQVDQLHNNPSVKNVRPIEGLQGKSVGVQYETKIGGRRIKDTFNPENGSRVHTEDYSDGLGTIREVTTTPAIGKEVTNKFRMRFDADGKETMVPLSDKWESHLDQLRREGINLKEIPSHAKSGWTRYSYEKDGKQIVEANRTSDGARYKKEEYLDHQGVANRDVSKTNANGEMVTNKWKLDQNGEWEFISKSGTGKVTEAVSPEAPPGRKSNSQLQLTKETMEAGEKWAADKIKSLQSDTHISNVKEVQLKKGWNAVEYTDSTGAKITEGYNPSNGSTHTYRDFKENGVRMMEDTLTIPKDNYKLWRLQKQVETSKSRMRRQDDPDSTPEYEWEVIDSTHHQNQRAAAAKLAEEVKTP